MKNHKLCICLLDPFSKSPDTNSLQWHFCKVAIVIRSRLCKFCKEPRNRFPAWRNRFPAWRKPPAIESSFRNLPLKCGFWPICCWIQWELDSENIIQWQEINLWGVLQEEIRIQDKKVISWDRSRGSQRNVIYLGCRGGQTDDFLPVNCTLGGRGMGCRDKYVTSWDPS